MLQGKTLYHSLQVRTISSGSQTVTGKSAYSIKHYTGGYYEDLRPFGATMEVTIVDRPWNTPEWFEDPNIQVLPNYPSTTLEGGRVRAVLTYAAQPEQEDTSQRRFISKQGHQCQVQRGFIYTHDVKVDYQYKDVDGSDLLWKNYGSGPAVAFTEDGHKVADNPAHYRVLQWRTPEVGFGRQGIGRVDFKAAEERWLRLEQQDCEEIIRIERPCVERDENGVCIRRRTREIFEGYRPMGWREAGRSHVTTLENEFKQSISITAIGTIKGR